MRPTFVPPLLPDTAIGCLLNWEEAPSRWQRREFRYLGNRLGGGAFQHSVSHACSQSRVIREHYDFPRSSRALVHEDTWKPRGHVEFREHEGRGFWRGTSGVIGRDNGIAESRLFGTPRSDRQQPPNGHQPEFNNLWKIVPSARIDATLAVRASRPRSHQPIRFFQTSRNQLAERTFMMHAETRIMDERRTLLILGWTLGSVVATIFILNAVMLSAPPP
jgi:hypothetical protein